MINKTLSYVFSLCLIGASLLLVQSANAQEEDSIKNLESQISVLKGRVIYVDFWASWCVPCRESFPWLNVMEAKYSDKGLTVISVNLDAQRSHAEDFLKEYPATFGVVYDPKGKVARKYQLRGMPSSFIVGRDGKVIESHVGFSKEKQHQYEQELREALGIKE